MCAPASVHGPHELGAIADRCMGDCDGEHTATSVLCDKAVGDHTHETPPAVASLVLLTLASFARTNHQGRAPQPMKGGLNHVAGTGVAPLAKQLANVVCVPQLEARMTHAA